MLCYPRVLTVQDISCVGQCSLTVALPVLSACGVETAVLPSAVLSTHTAGFSGYTFRDLTDDMPAITAHWQKEGIAIDAIYTGYLGSVRQIACVKNLFRTVAKPDCVRIVDPAMADNGALYPGFDAAFVGEMKGLCAEADYVIPNVTEACLLTDTPYLATYNVDEIATLVDKLLALGAKNVVLTGVSFADGVTGVVVANRDATDYYDHEQISKGCHGTGDIYASAFTGALLQGHSAYDAAAIAADFVVACIKQSHEIGGHWYGACFEPVLGQLIEAVKG